MTSDVIRFLTGGLLFNALCGVLLGNLLAFTLRDRLSPRAATAAMGLIAACLVSGALWALYRTHPDCFWRMPAGLMIYPFFNKLTAGTPIGKVLALLADAAWMTLFARWSWRRILKRRGQKRFLPRSSNPGHEDPS